LRLELQTKTAAAALLMRCAQDSRGIASRPPKSSGARRAGRTRAPARG
jgi:hypothetical protein